MQAIPLACLVALALATSAPAAAQDARPDDKAIVNSSGFLSAHPDLMYRLWGQDAYRQGDPADALGHFRRAARYADKPSQGMLGEMHWNGTGTAVDRVMGYVWMDLAAERGYPLMLVKREKYWAQLTEDERRRALEIGPAHYDEYGDAAAQPRLARELRRAKRDTTGSRVGSVGNLTIMIPTPGGMRQVDGSAYYDERFWDVDQYFQWQDKDWKEPPKGSVDVGEVMSADSLPAAPAEATEGD